MNFYSLFCILSLFFIGCGDSGNGEAGEDNQTVKTGIFIDSPVQGLYYKTTTKSGFTNEKGEYQYIEGETVEFKFGDLSLGTVVAQTLITPYSMETNNSNIQAINIAVLLQSLDASRDEDMILDVRKLQNHKFIGISLDENETIITDKIKQLLDANDSIGDPNNRAVIPYSTAKTTMDDFINNFPLIGNDPKRNEQWYIDKLGLDTIGGKRINQTYIQIVDDGFESNHEDLKENYDANHSWNPKLITPQNDPTSWNPDYNHGSQVAGIIGARGFNGKGVRGVAPYSKLVGYAFLYEDENGTHSGLQGLEQAWLSGDGANDILVTNNSWGSSIDYYYDAENIAKIGATLLRDGKGRIYVMAGGNARVPKASKNDNTRFLTGNSNLSNMANNQYVIAVGSINQNDTVSYYSSKGSNLLVTAYGDSDGNTNNIVTTTNNNGYSTKFNGTSASAPMVSGIIGLVLEACPDLTYRDVKYLLATTSNIIDSSNPTWVKNSANLWHSVDYGYGVVDAREMLDVCHNFQTLPEAKEINSTILNIYPAINITFGSSGIDFNSNNIVTNIAKVEWVGVYFQALKHLRPSDLQITLTSPSGTKTELLQGENMLDEKDLMPEDNGIVQEMYIRMRLSSQAFYDENPNGVWTINIADKNDNGKNGSIDSIKLQIVGH
ncbi:MAG: S8 family serine peptidase [Sulfurimonas sp.]|nr:S8 family serine peptidase [Sulfurimonas sp.]MDD3060752.1 S8 family serine peptidase [Sulfurimonas sp.]